MFACTTDRYDDLYAPWLARPSLLESAYYFDLRGARVLDLCGGTGAEAEFAAAHDAARVVLLDLNPRCDYPGVTTVRGRAEDAASLVEGPFDVVVVRQAMGYLDPAATARQVAMLLAPGGKFIFNTFNEPARAGLKKYFFGGAAYAEAHLYVAGRVLHLQRRRGNGIDISVFRHHSADTLAAALRPWFDVEVWLSRGSQRWVATLRDPKTAARTAEPRARPLPACTCSVGLAREAICLPGCPRGVRTGRIYPSWDAVPDDILTVERYRARHGREPPKCPKGHRIYSTTYGPTGGCVCDAIAASERGWS